MSQSNSEQDHPLRVLGKSLTEKESERHDSSDENKCASEGELKYHNLTDDHNPFMIGTGTRTTPGEASAGSPLANSCFKGKASGWQFWPRMSLFSSQERDRGSVQDTTLDPQSAISSHHEASTVADAPVLKGAAAAGAEAGAEAAPKVRYAYYTPLDSSSDAANPLPPRHAADNVQAELQMRKKLVPGDHVRIIGGNDENVGKEGVVMGFDKEGDPQVLLSDGTEFVFRADEVSKDLDSCKKLLLGDHVRITGGNDDNVGKEGVVTGFDKEGDPQVRLSDGTEFVFRANEVSKDLECPDNSSWISWMWTCDETASVPTPHAVVVQDSPRLPPEGKCLLEPSTVVDVRVSQAPEIWERGQIFVVNHEDGTYKVHLPNRAAQWIPVNDVRLADEIMLAAV